MIDIVQVVLLLLVLLISFYSLWKIRKIHIWSYEKGEEIGRIHEEIGGFYWQMQSFIELNSLLDIKWPLPALRGWAASPDFLLELAKEVLSKKPEVVVECSSGASTVVIARCLEINGKGKIYSLEHDPVYAQKTREHLNNSGLRVFSEVIDAPLTDLELDDWKGSWYSLKNFPVRENEIDLLVVDGPPNSVAKLARFPAFEMLKPYFKDRFTIYLDDANREAELETIKRWKRKHRTLSVVEIACEKGCVKIERSG